MNVDLRFSHCSQHNNGSQSDCDCGCERESEKLCHCCFVTVSCVINTAWLLFKCGEMWKNDGNVTSERPSITMTLLCRISENS